MNKLIKFGKKIAMPSTVEIKHELRMMSAADDLIGAGLLTAPSPAPSQDAAHVSSDLARKHGISVDRAQMLVDRFGSNRHTLEGAAQSLRTRMD